MALHALTYSEIMICAGNQLRGPEPEFDPSLFSSAFEPLALSDTPQYKAAFSRLNLENTKEILTDKIIRAATDGEVYLSLSVDPSGLSLLIDQEPKPTLLAKYPTSSWNPKGPSEWTGEQTEAFKLAIRSATLHMMWSAVQAAEAAVTVYLNTWVSPTGDNLYVYENCLTVVQHHVGRLKAEKRKHAPSSSEYTRLTDEIRKQLKIYSSML